MSTPVQQNNATPLNQTSQIPTTSSSGSSSVASALPSLAATSPLYEKAINQLGGGHVFRLQRNGVTFATGIMENDPAVSLHATYKPAASAELIRNGAQVAGSALGNSAATVGQRAGQALGGSVAGRALGGAGAIIGRAGGGLAGKLLSANKAASALAWDFQDGQYWEQDIRFTLIRVGTTGEQDVLARFYAMAEAVTSQESGGVFTGPFGMGIDGNVADGSLGITLMVGSWLTVDDLLVTSLDSTFSRIVTVDGKPYMAGIHMHVKTRTAISHNVDLKRFLNQ